MAVDIRGRRDGVCGSCFFLPWWGEDRADGIQVMEMGRIHGPKHHTVQVEERKIKAEVNTLGVSVEKAGVTGVLWPASAARIHRMVGTYVAEIIHESAWFSCGVMHTWDWWEEEEEGLLLCLRSSCWKSFSSPKLLKEKKKESQQAESTHM